MPPPYASGNAARYPAEGKGTRCAVRSAALGKRKPPATPHMRLCRRIPRVKTTLRHEGCNIPLRHSK